MNKDIASKISRELVRFLRDNKERTHMTHLLVGRQEYEELSSLDNVLEDYGPEQSITNIKIVKVDEDSYFSGAYILDEEERKARLLEEMTSEKDK